MYVYMCICIYRIDNYNYVVANLTSSALLLLLKRREALRYTPRAYFILENLIILIHMIQRSGLQIVPSYFGELAISNVTQLWLVGNK